MAEATGEVEIMDGEAAAQPSKLPFIIGIVNLVAVLAAAGTFAYTRVIYQRPKITEQSERARLLLDAKKKAIIEASGYVEFEPFTADLSPDPNPLPVSESPERVFRGKTHRIHLGFSLRIRDKEKANEIEAVRSALQDRLLTILGNKTYQEVSTVQGRYLLRSQIVEAANDLTKNDLVLDAYFNKLILH